MVSLLHLNITMPVIKLSNTLLIVARSLRTIVMGRFAPLFQEAIFKLCLTDGQVFALT